MDDVIQLGALIGAIGVISGVLFSIYKFYLRQLKQDKELNEIRTELGIICYGLTACLSGLKEQGCNGQVTDALNHLEKHVNQQAHKNEV